MKKVQIERLEMLKIGVLPVILYNQLVDRDVNQKLNPSFKGGEIEFQNDGSNYSRKVFKEALSKARLLSN